MNTPNVGYVAPRRDVATQRHLTDLTDRTDLTVLTELTTTARQVLARNSVTHHTSQYTMPAPAQYPHQWNWDSSVIALGLATHDAPRALTEIASLLSAQWENGMVPHIVFHDPAQQYFPDFSFWQTDAHSRSGFASSGITQPPLIATALQRIAEQHDITDFIRTWYPSIAKWHRWFHTDRAVDNSGLTVSLHPWESGMDDSPRWLNVLSRVKPDMVVEYSRVDTKNVRAAERPSSQDYDRFIYLVDLQRRSGWDTKKALATLPFRVQDVLVNSVLVRADADLIWLGKHAGIDTTDVEEMHENALAHFTQAFWNESRGLFLDRDLHSGTTIHVNTAATFMPLWAGIATPEQANRVIHEHLLNPAEYWSEPGSGYVVPTCARTEPAWSPHQYWRGPVWVLMNWFVHGGLAHYGFHDLAERVKRDTVHLVQRHGFSEYFNCTNGARCGIQEFSWSAALLLDLLNT